jgi:hypothetical protein
MGWFRFTSVATVLLNGSVAVADSVVGKWIGHIDTFITEMSPSPTKGRLLPARRRLELTNAVTYRLYLLKGGKCEMEILPPDGVPWRQKGSWKLKGSELVTTLTNMKGKRAATLTAMYRWDRTKKKLLGISLLDQAKYDQTAQTVFTRA